MMLVEMTSFGLLFPVLPNRVAALVGPGPMATMGYGGVILVFSIGFLLAVSLTGPLSDRYGRRPLMLWNCAGLTVGNLVAAIAPGIGLFALCRGLCGLSNTNIALAQAYVADLSSPSERGGRFGIMGAMQGLGFILGPILGGYLGHQDPRIPFLLAGVASAVNGVVGFFLLKESLLPGQRTSSATASVNPLRVVADLRRLPGFGALVPALGVLTLSQNVMITAWVPYATLRFGWGPRENGWGLFLYGATAAIAQGLLFPVMVKRVPLRWICQAAMASTGITYLAFGCVHEGRWVFGLMVANVVGFLAYIGFQTLASERTGASHQGHTMGGLQALNNLTLVLSPICTSGLLYATTLWPASDWRAGLPMYFIAGLVFLALALSHRPLAKDPDSTN